MSDAEDEALEASYGKSFAMLGELGLNPAVETSCRIRPRWRPFTNGEWKRFDQLVKRDQKVKAKPKRRAGGISHHRHGCVCACCQPDFYRRKSKLKPATARNIKAARRRLAAHGIHL